MTALCSRCICLSGRCRWRGSGSSRDPARPSARVQLEERLRASEARWRTIVESAVDAIIVIDRHGRVEAFNPAAERLFGYTNQEAVGQNVSMLMPSPYHEEHDGYSSDTAGGKSADHRSRPRGDGAPQ